MWGRQVWYLVSTYALAVLSLGCQELAHAANTSSTFEATRSLRRSMPTDRDTGESGPLYAGHRLPQRGRQEHTRPVDSAKGQMH